MIIGRCCNASQHGEGMLQAKQHGQKNGHWIIEAEEGRGCICLGEEWNVGTEEVGVVIITDQAFARGESMADSS